MWKVRIHSQPSYYPLNSGCEHRLFSNRLNCLCFAPAVFIILSLWLAKDGKKNYRPGGRELLAHAISDTGVGVEPIMDPRIAALPISEGEKNDSNVIVVSPLFAAIHGIQHGDICHARRVKHHSIGLDSVSLLPLSAVDDYDPKELVDCLLAKAHLVSQNGLILTSHPKSQSSNSTPTTKEIANGTNGVISNGNHSTSHPGEPTQPLYKSYLAFIVLDASPLCQGVLTRKSTIYIVPPSGRSSSPSSPDIPSTFDTRLHELFYTSMDNGTVSQKWNSIIFPAASPTLSASLSQFNMSTSGTNNSTTPTKPLMRSSMLVVPLGGSPASPLSNTLGYSSARSTFGTTSLQSPSQHSRTQIKSPGTRGTTPSLSPASGASAALESHRDVLNRSLLRISIISEPLVKIALSTSKLRSNGDSSSANASSRPNSNEFEGDKTLEVGVSLETMKQQMLGVFNGSWVEVSVAFTARTSSRSSRQNLNSSSANSEYEPRRQLARIYVTETASDSTLYIPPNMAFNLGLDSSITTNLVKVTPMPSVDAFLRDPSAQNHPNLGAVSKLHYAIIVRPNPPHYSISTRALARFFSKPRILRKGEVFGVVTKRPKFAEVIVDPSLGDDDSDSDEEILQEDAVADFQAACTEEILQVVYFKVTSVSFAPSSTSTSVPSQEPYYAYIPAKSEVIADQFVHSTVPPGHDAFLVRSLQSRSSPLRQLISPHALAPHTSASRLLLNNPVSNAVAAEERPAFAGLDSLFEELQAILTPCLHPMSSSFGLFVSVLVHGARGSGKTRLARTLAESLGISVLSINCYDLVGHTDVETEKRVSETFERAANCSPVLLILSEFSAFDKTKSEASMEPPIANAFKEQFAALASIHARTGHPVMVLATAENAADISRNLRSLFRVELAVQSPDEAQRHEVLRAIFSGPAGWRLHRSVGLRDLALRTASFTRKSLYSLVTKAGEAAIRRVLKFQAERLKKVKNALEAVEALEKDIASAGVSLTVDDFDAALSVMQAANASAMGMPKIPQVKWDDVGGLYEAKKDILDTIQLPLLHPELFASNSGAGQRSGILLYGPPGTGKTLLAKAVATECSLNFISVKGPELINMYIGESEKNVREVFQRARDARPCVIFFDELDSLAPNRGRNGDSGGVMDRIVSQLLAELSDASAKSDVFVIGATNRPDLIDPALLVPGRFDKLIFLGVNAEVSQKHNVLTALTRKFTLARGCDLLEIAKMCPVNLTGADLYALCSDAMAFAIKSQIEALKSLSQEKLDQLKKDETTMSVTLEQGHFVSALQQLTPSVSMEELERYKEMASRFQKKM